MKSVIDKLAWISIQDRRVLAARSRSRRLFYIPGGKRESGESDVEALMREIREELGVTLIEATLWPHGVFHADADASASGVTVQITTYRGEAEGQPRPLAEIEELRWLSSADMASASPATRLILVDLQNRDLID